MPQENHEHFKEFQHLACNDGHNNTSNLDEVENISIYQNIILVYKEYF